MLRNNLHDFVAHLFCLSFLCIHRNSETVVATEPRGKSETPHTHTHLLFVSYLELMPLFHLLETVDKALPFPRMALYAVKEKKKKIVLKQLQSLQCKVHDLFMMFLWYNLMVQNPSVPKLRYSQCHKCCPDEKTFSR